MPLSNGPHEVKVLATDVVGNTDSARIVPTIHNEQAPHPEGPEHSRALPLWAMIILVGALVFVVVALGFAVYASRRRPPPGGAAPGAVDPAQVDVDHKP